jgi:hypothetical protein
MTKTLLNPTPGYPIVVAPTQTRMLYRIRFQNTGPDTAFNVAVVDTLEPNLRPETFEMLEASHPYSVELVDNHIFVWTFANIQLPDSNVNEPASHGHIRVSLQRQSGLPLGSEVENSGHIYFDFNEPAATEPSVVQVNDVSSRAQGAPAVGNLRA